jgi:DNA polymerase III subunit chi
VGEVWFYHLTERSLDAALRPLLARMLREGWRVEVRGSDPALMGDLDLKLWEPEESFLPHGLAGGPHDARQPILLTHAPVGGRDALIAVGSAEVPVEEVAATRRTALVFDGRTEVEGARAQWRRFQEAGLGLRYWAEEGGAWTLRQERPARA